MPVPLISSGPLFKSAVFGSNSLLPTLVGWGGGLVCESVGKADLLSVHFDSEPVDLPLTCHSSPSLITVALRSRKISLLWLLALYHFFYFSTHMVVLTNSVCFLLFL